MKIYFAGSIRGGRDDQEIYFKIIALIGKYGTVLTEHIGNKKLSSYGESIPTAEIYARDMKWLMSADAVVAEVTNPSLGVGYEIGQFETTTRPVLCLYREIPGKRISAMLEGNPNIIVKAYSDLESVDQILADFFQIQIMKNPWKTIKTHVVYKNPWMTVRHDDVIRPDGKKGIYGVVEKRDFALIIPVYQKKLYLVNIYRYPVQAESWEFPEGDWEPKETHRAAAQRELLEETGFKSGKLIHLAHLWLAVGFCSQGFNMYLADECRRVSNLTDADITRMNGFTLKQLEKMIQQGKIKDSPTITAVYLYKKYLHK